MISRADEDTLAQQVGPGWELLVRLACRAAEEHDRIVSVKEKWGTLRMDAQGSDDFLDMIERMEDLSSEICEECGSAFGVTTEGGWIKTLCADCREDSQCESQ